MGPLKLWRISGRPCSPEALGVLGGEAHVLHVSRPKAHANTSWKNISILVIVNGWEEKVNIASKH